MKRILITLSALLLIMTAGYAQKNMFEKMPPNQRDSILIETAKNAVLKYAPGYYRDYKTGSHFQRAAPKDYRIKEDRGRLFYQVTFFYDPLKEKNMPKLYRTSTYLGGQWKSLQHVFYE